MFSVAVVSLLVVSGIAYFFLRPANSGSGGETGPQLDLQDLTRAISEFEDVVNQPMGHGAWGIDGYIAGKTVEGKPTVNYTIRLVWDPIHEGYQARVVVSKSSYHSAEIRQYEKVQAGKYITLEVDGNTTVKRDENPQTVKPPYNASLVGHWGFSPSLFTLESTRRVQVEGHPATLFAGREQNTSMEISVYEDSKKLARYSIPRFIYSDNSNVYELIHVYSAMDFTVLWGADAQLPPATSQGTRAPIKAPFTKTMRLSDPSFGSDGSSRKKYDWDVSKGHVEEVRLDEIEVRILNNSSNKTIEASMRLDQGERTVGNFEIRYNDRDSDGLLSAGDRLFLRALDDGITYDGELLDLWASATPRSETGADPPVAKLSVDHQGTLYTPPPPRP